MNEEWISDSHKSAELFRNRPLEHDEMRLIRILDVAGMFETSWLLFDHFRNPKKYRYGYPK